MKKGQYNQKQLKLKLILITNNIRLLREDKNYTQQHMAQRLYISQNAYSKMELGHSTLTLERLLLIAQALDINAIDLLNFDDLSAGLPVFSEKGKVKQA